MSWLLVPEAFQTTRGARYCELFRYLEKAFYMNDRDELSTLAFFAISDPEAARLWAEFIRQERAGLHH